MLIESPLYIGRYQCGVEVPFVLQCTDVNNSPNDPLAIPSLSIYLDGAPPVLKGTYAIPADLRGTATGVFRFPLFLDTLYRTTGRYLAIFKWTDSNGVAHHKPGSFYILPGGHPDGAILSMVYIQRPDATYLMHQNDSGRLVRGRNPRVTQ